MVQRSYDTRRERERNGSYVALYDDQTRSRAVNFSYSCSNLALSPVSAQHRVHRVLEAQHDQQRQLDQLRDSRVWRCHWRSGGMAVTAADAKLGAHLSGARIFPSVFRVYSPLSPRRRRRRHSAGTGGVAEVSRMHAKRPAERVPGGGDPITSAVMGSDVCCIAPQRML